MLSAFRRFFSRNSIATQGSNLTHYHNVGTEKVKKRQLRRYAFLQAKPFFSGVAQSVNFKLFAGETGFFFLKLEFEVSPNSERRISRFVKDA